MRKSSIFCGTDLTASASLAARRAQRIARELDLRFVLAHVVPEYLTLSAHALVPPQYGTRLSTGGRRGGAAVETTAKRHLGMLGSWIEKLELAPDATRVLVGRTHDEILAAARAARSRLIVTGVHRGESRAKSLLLGTTTDRLLRKSDVPILLARTNPKRAYTTAVVAVDLGDMSASVLAAARAFAPEAKLHVLYVLHGSAKGAMTVASARSRLEALAGEVEGVDCTATVLEGDPRKRILAFAERRRASLVVVGTRARKGLERLMLGSVAEFVLRSADVDVLAVPPS